GAARPGGNVTGLSINPTLLAAKRLELLKEVVPGLARVALLWNPDNPQSAAEAAATRTAAERLGLELVPLEVRVGGEVRRTVEAARTAGAGALVTLDDLLFWLATPAIVDPARRYRLPTLFDPPEMVERGGLICYTTDVAAMTPRVAWYVDKILRG